MKVVLAGGWGYENLGDEAILASYIEALSDIVDLTITSADPARTTRAQRGGPVVVREGSARGATLLVGGGGYLNGRWIPEIYRKLWDLRRMAAGEVVAHGVEVRRMDGPVRQKLFNGTFTGAAMAVRDELSALEVDRIGCVPSTLTVAPDAITLLAPHLDKYGVEIPEMRGKVVLNLLDISHRSDADEAEIDIERWDDFVRELVRRLGKDAVGLVGGGGDRAYATGIVPDLTLVEPHTVPAMVSVLRSARAVLSVRMHPALLASALGTPVVSVPYCGKVRPTLERIGVDDCILTALDVDRVMADLTLARDHAAAWTEAHAVSSSWLLEALQP